MPRWQGWQGACSATRGSQAQAAVIAVGGAAVEVLLAVVEQDPDDGEHQQQRNAEWAGVDAEGQASAVACGSTAVRSASVKRSRHAPAVKGCAGVVQHCTPQHASFSTCLHATAQMVKKCAGTPLRRLSTSANAGCAARAAGRAALTAATFLAASALHDTAAAGTPLTGKQQLPQPPAAGRYHTCVARAGPSHLEWYHRAAQVSGVHHIMCIMLCRQQQQSTSHAKTVCFPDSLC